MNAKSKPHTIRQHYVPQFLLKNFSDNGKEVYVWDKKKKTLFKADVKSICYQNDLYDVKWENGNHKLGKYILDNKLENEFTQSEGKAASLIKAVLTRVDNSEQMVILDSDEKELLYDFITLLYLRNPAQITEICNYYEGVEDEPEMNFLRNGVEYIFDQWGWGSSDSIFEYSLKAGIFSNEIEGSPFLIERKRIGGLKYVFWKSEEGEFITSSFPIHIASDDEESFSRVLVPLSKNLAVVLFKELPYGLKEGMLLSPGESNIRYNMRWFFNTYTEETARFFIGRNKEILKRIL